MENKFKVLVYFICSMTMFSCSSDTQNTEAESGYQTIYVTTNEVGAKCILENHSGTYVVNNTPDFIKIKIDGDLKISCSKDQLAKSCISKARLNYGHEPYRVGIDKIFIPGNFLAREISGHYYDKFSCVDLRPDTNWHGCANSINPDEESYSYSKATPNSCDKMVEHFESSNIGFLMQQDKFDKDVFSETVKPDSEFGYTYYHGKDKIEPATNFNKSGN